LVRWKWKGMWIPGQGVRKPHHWRPAASDRSLTSPFKHWWGCGCGGDNIMRLKSCNCGNKRPCLNYGQMPAQFPEKHQRPSRTGHCTLGRAAGELAEQCSDLFRPFDPSSQKVKEWVSVPRLLSVPKQLKRLSDWTSVLGQFNSCMVQNSVLTSSVLSTDLGYLREHALCPHTTFLWFSSVRNMPMMSQSNTTLGRDLSIYEHAYCASLVNTHQRDGNQKKMLLMGEWK
jgi:hypothetical protein